MKKKRQKFYNDLLETKLGTIRVKDLSSEKFYKLTSIHLTSFLKEFQEVCFGIL